MEGSAVKQIGYGYRTRHAFRWDEKTFFEDAEHKTMQSEALAMIRLFHYCCAVSQVRWGGGYIDGSFSPVFPGVSVRPPITVFSNGRLRVSFGNLRDEETSYICRDALAEKLEGCQGIAVKIPLELRAQNISVPASAWAEDVEKIIGALEHMRSKAP